MKSKIKGVAAVKRRLKQLPDAVSAEIVDVLRDNGPRLRAAMQARARRRTGKLAAGVKYRVLPKSLRLQVGLLGARKARAKLFYGKILDRGRRAKTVIIRRGPRRGASMRIRAIAADYFVTGRYTELRVQIGRGINGLYDRALKRIAGGAGD